MQGKQVLALGPGVPEQRHVGQHPLGLYILFFTEMWERFAYYGMRALLVYYMTKHLFLPEWKAKVLGHAALMAGLSRVFGDLDVKQQSSQVYGLYTAFVYLTPLAGGYIADRYIGQRKSVYVGGVVMGAGLFTLMWEHLFYVGLVLLIVGNGFFKPNISTQVGSLYPKGDARRDRAFMIFYVGINLGAFLSPFICGTLGESARFGWAWGFGSAGVGMVGGLALYTFGQRYLAPDNVMKRSKEMVEVTRKAEGGAYRDGEVKDLVPAKPKPAPFTSEERGRASSGLRRSRRSVHAARRDRGHRAPRSRCSQAQARGGTSVGDAQPRARATRGPRPAGSAVPLPPPIPQRRPVGPAARGRAGIRATSGLALMSRARRVPARPREGAAHR